MTAARTSYFKTTLLAGFGAIAVLTIVYALAGYVGTAQIWLMSLAWLLALPLLAVTAGGCVVLYRYHRLSTGQRDLFLHLNRGRSEAALADEKTAFALRLRRVIPALFGSRQLLVGEWVTIRSFDEIRRTLDDQDGIDGLPFMSEMIQHCGKRARVYRRVDKIYDYGGKKDLRRLRNVVLLHGLRCNGASHGDCQAGCYLMWKEAWLTRASHAGVESSTGAATGATGLRKPPVTTDAAGTPVYFCQFTQLVSASTPLSTRDIRQDLRPLLAGNLTVGAFLVALLTRLFNVAQRQRGGVGFPPVQVGGAQSKAVVNLGLIPGDRVRVNSITDIGQTLDAKGKNRGLWFDRDMTKHCGHEYRVLKRVERIIDDANGQMRTMKTPCIVLDGISYSSEGLRFCSQEDPTFWREAWLSRSDAPSEMPVATNIQNPRH